MFRRRNNVKTNSLIVSSLLEPDNTNEVYEKDIQKASHPFQPKFKPTSRIDKAVIASAKEVYIPLQRIEGYTDHIRASIAAKRLEEKIREAAAKRMRAM